MRRPFRLPALSGLVAAVVVLPACSGSSPGSPPSPAPPLSFSTSVPVGGLCCLVYEPQIVADGNVVYVSWVEAIRYTTYLPMRRSTDGGRSFPDPLTFADTSRGDRNRIRLAAAEGGRGLFAAWRDSREGVCDPFCRGYRVYATRSVDDGTSFAANSPVEVDPGGGEQRSPALALGMGSDVYLAWETFQGGDREIRFARSTDDLASFDPSIPIDAEGASPRNQHSPSIAVEPDGRIHVAWLDRRSGVPEVYLAHSGDRGASFQVAGALHPADSEVSDRDAATIALTDEGTLVAAWTEQRSGRWQVRCATSLDGGQTFTSPEAVDAAGTGDQLLPSMVADAADSVYVAWQDDRSGGERVRIARSTDGAESFEGSILIADPGAAQGDQRGPALALHPSGDVLATWVDFDNPNGVVFAARSAR